VSFDAVFVWHIVRYFCCTCDSVA